MSEAEKGVAWKTGSQRDGSREEGIYSPSSKESHEWAGCASTDKGQERENGVDRHGQPSLTR